MWYRLWEILSIIALVTPDREHPGCDETEILGDMEKKRLEVTCPCCQARLIIDATTGLVIHSDAKKAGYSFDDALRQEKERKTKSDEIFARAFADEKKRQSSLEAKFEEALRSKDELDEPPPRPFDLD